MALFSKNSVQESLLSSDFYLRKCGNRRITNFDEFETAVYAQRDAGLPARIYLDGVVGEKIFSAWGNRVPRNPVEVYIHQGDRIPSSNLMKKMHELRFMLYSVNWLGDTKICKPIPVGIPTKSFQGFHGKLIYESALNAVAGKDRKKEHQIYVNFDITTNIIQRKLALENLVRHADSFVPNQRLSVEKNLTNIQHSKYVISPPGAGADCYRTWEALYLGAIPVVLRKFWPFNHLDLPVKVVDSYSSFLQEIKDEEVYPQTVSVDYILSLPDKFL